MAGKDEGSREGAAAPVTFNLDEIEESTFRKVGGTLAAIENAIAVWDSAKAKPQRLKKRINRLKKLHAALSAWESKASRIKGEGRRLKERLAMLHEFSMICGAFA